MSGRLDFGLESVSIGCYYSTHLSNLAVETYQLFLHIEAHNKLTSVHIYKHPSLGRDVNVWFIKSFGW